MQGRFRARFCFSAFVLFLAVCNGLAQKVKDTGPKYDTTNEIKIKGVVEEVREVPGNFEGTHLVVKTETTTVLVHVAPAFAKGDQVQVTGSKSQSTSGAVEEILAREITVGTNTVTLRDDKGVPVWVGWSPSKTSGN